jgi:hypothetical protein
VVDASPSPDGSTTSDGGMSSTGDGTTDPSAGDTGTGDGSPSGDTGTAGRSSGPSTGGSSGTPGESGGRRTSDRGASGSTGGGWGGDSGGAGSTGDTQSPAGTADTGGSDYVPPEDPQSGREAGKQLADAYRGKQRGPWGGDSGGSFGGGARFRERARIPRDLTPGERAAAGVMTQINQAQTRYQRQHGRYGSLSELAEAGMFAGRVGAGVRQFAQHNYSFDLTVQDDGYTLLATPRGGGLRALQTADHGFIEYADE